ncbi:MAG: DUF5654 family protein [Patescibacteria group bacterium]
MSKKSLKLEILQKVSELATAGFGLVAALAWNDAIQSLFKKLFGTQSEVWAKFVYALIITGLVVLITMRLGNLVDKLKHQDNNDSEK